MSIDMVRMQERHATEIAALRERAEAAEAELNQARHARDNAGILGFDIPGTITMLDQEYDKALKRIEQLEAVRVAAQACLAEADQYAREDFVTGWEVTAAGERLRNALLAAQQPEGEKD